MPLSALPFDGKKTGAEQTMLRNLQELEAELLETESSDRKKQLSGQISLLKSELLKLQGLDYPELYKENSELKEKLKKLEEKYSSLQLKCKPVMNKEEAEGLDESSPLKLRLYRFLLNKYSFLINDSSKKTVGEVKALISDEDLSIQSLIAKFRGENYDFDRDYVEAAKALFEFMKNEFSFVKADLDVNFWLSPSELLKEKIGDDEDLAIFLCSGLFALGDRKAEVLIVELDNLGSHAFVITELKDKFLLLDPNQKHSFQEFLGSKQSVLKKYSFQGAKIKCFLYKFNHFSYEQF